MKTSSKIWVALVSFIWAILAFFLVLLLCREMDWAIIVGEWITNTWNGVFGSSHTVAGFFSRLEDVLFYFGCAYSVLTIIFIICCVKVNSEADEEKIARKEAKKNQKKKEEAEMKKKIVEGEAKVEKKKKHFSLRKAASEVKDVAEATETAAASSEKTVSDFLERLRKSK